MVGIEQQKSCFNCSGAILGTYKKKFCSIRCARLYHVKKYQSKVVPVYKEKGLCRKCGKPREDQDWKHCERCRAIWKRYNAKKNKCKEV